MSTSDLGRPHDAGGDQLADRTTAVDTGTPGDRALPADSSPQPDRGGPGDDGGHLLDASCRSLPPDLDAAFGDASCSRPDAAAFYDPSAFCLRPLVAHEIPWDDLIDSGRTTREAYEADYVCRLDYEAVHGLVYLRTRPTGGNMMSGTSYVAEGLWVYNGCAVQGVPLALVGFSNGGIHFCGAVEFPFAGYQFRLHARPFGQGYFCNTDCLEVYDGSGALIVDGCITGEIIPAACVAVSRDGTVPPLQ